MVCYRNEGTVTTVLYLTALLMRAPKSAKAGPSSNGRGCRFRVRRIGVDFSSFRGHCDKTSGDKAYHVLMTNTGEHKPQRSLKHRFVDLRKANLRFPSCTFMSLVVHLFCFRRTDPRPDTTSVVLLDHDQSCRKCSPRDFLQLFAL